MQDVMDGGSIEPSLCILGSNDRDMKVLIVRLQAFIRRPFHFLV